MTQLNDLKVYGLQKINSLDFIKNVFQLYTSNKVIAFLDSNASSSVMALNISKTIIPDDQYGWYKIAQPPIESDAPAQIVFTSGTEGKPKAILLSHKALSDVVLRLNSIMEVDETIKEYIGVPVTYSFGLGRCRAVCAAGGAFYIPENGFNPTEISRMLNNDEINAISSVPTLWRMILMNPDVIGESGKKVKWIEIGSQYMSKMEKEQMKNLFPNAKIIQHYGLTEASRSTFLDISSVSGAKLESVGKAYGDIEIDINNEGRIKIRGPNTAMGFLKDNEIQTLLDKDSWLLTSDNGHIEDDYLYYDGRSDDIINFGGIKINPDLLQSAIENTLQIENNIAICKISDDLRGEGIFIAVDINSPLELADVKNAAHKELDNIGIKASSSLVISYVDEIPRTTTGKLQRKDLAKKLIKPIDPSPTNVGHKNNVISIYKKIFPRETVSNNSNFKELGGDSLNYVQLTMMLEKHLGHLPHQWDSMPIKKLEATKIKERQHFANVEIASFLRALAILFVVGTHSGVEVLGGGTLLLVFLVGYNFSRFKSKSIIEGDIWLSLWGYLRPIFIPYYLLAAAYLYWNKSFEIDVLLMYANLLEAKITVVFPFWFVQVLVQCLLIIALIFSVNASRSALKISPWAFSFTILIVLIIVRILYPFFWDTSPLNDLVPLRFMAIIWLGWCFYYADSPYKKGLLVLCSTIFAFIDTGLRTETLWLIVGSICLAYVPYIKTPHYIKNMIHILASATFYIFVFNGIFIYLILEVLKIDSSLLAFLVGLSSSLLIWWVVQYTRLAGKIDLLLSS